MTTATMPPMRARGDRDVARTRTTADDALDRVYEVYRRRRARRSSCCRPRRSSIRASGRARSPTSAGHCRVVAYDGRGNGRSDRPTSRRRTRRPLVDDLVAVMDATGTRRAVLVGLCGDARVAPVQFAVGDRSGSSGSSRSPSGVPLLTPPHPWRVAVRRSMTSCRPTRAGRRSTATTGGATTPGFVRFFFGEITSEPHSTKVIEDAVGWALDGSVDAMLADHDVGVPSTARRSRRSAAAYAARCSSSTAPTTTASRVARAHALAELPVRRS